MHALSFAWRLNLCFLFAAFIILIPADVFAIIIPRLPPVVIPREPKTPIGNVLCTAASWISGNVGKGLATIGVGYIGVKSLRGQMKKGKAILGVVGIAIVFGAVPILMSIRHASTSVLSTPTAGSSTSYCNGS